MRQATAKRIADWSNRRDESGTVGLSNPKEHVPYSTIDTQHSRTISKLNEPDE
jgi:hypothetical protein